MRTTRSKSIMANVIPSASSHFEPEPELSSMIREPGALLGSVESAATDSSVHTSVDLSGVDQVFKDTAVPSLLVSILSDASSKLSTGVLPGFLTDN